MRRCTVKMVGTWTGNQGVLEEDLVYSDGTKERHVWRLADQGHGRYSGRADDGVGEMTPAFSKP